MNYFKLVHTINSRLKAHIHTHISYIIVDFRVCVIFCHFLIPLRSMMNSVQLLKATMHIQYAWFENSFLFCLKTLNKIQIVE